MVSVSQRPQQIRFDKKQFEFSSSIFGLRSINLYINAMRGVCQIIRLRRLPWSLFAALASLAITASAFSGGRVTAQGTARLLMPAPGTVSAETLLRSTGWSQLIESGDLRAENSRPQSTWNRLSYLQHYAGIPVVGGRLVIRTDDDGNVLMAHSSLATWRHESNPEFRISPESAITRARDISHLQEFATLPTVERVVLPRAGAPVFCYRVKVTLSRPAQAMEYYFDGSDGTLLLAEDHLKRFDGRGLVFDPDPKSALQNDDLEDEDDDSAAIPIEAYIEAALPDISYDEDSLLVLSGQWADTSPTENRCRSETGEFFFDRSDDHFEEVMAYYHIVRQAQYLIDLEIMGVPSPQLLDINRIEDDASFFNPQTGVITTGTGGVDDAEDADVLLHEYTHGVIEAIIPGWRGGDTGMLTEGLCDYFAGDHSLAVAPDFEPMEIYNWDGHNQFWDGRILNSGYHYPEDSEREIHDAGQLWSSLLTEVRLSGDRDEWNRVVVDHIGSFADSATVPDAVRGLLASDAILAGGSFRRAIVTASEQRGILSPGECAPVIRHTSPRDSEDEDAATEISVVIQADPWIGLDADNLWLIYHFENAEPESLLLEYYQGLSDVYKAVIPAPYRETVVSYYFFAADRGGLFSVDPPEAPEEQHHFIIGPDRVAPVIRDQDRLPDTVFPEGEAQFGVTVRDNIAVGEVRLIWFDAELNPLGEAVLLSREGEEESYLGTIRWRIDRDESLAYRVRATDTANNPNVTESPLRFFTVRSEALIDDFERTNHRWQLTGWERTDSERYSGEWSMTDRSPGEMTPPREAQAEINEVWRFAGMGHARLRFAERHMFDRSVMEHGAVEIWEQGGDDWQEIFTVAGIQGDWMEREIDLDRWAVRNSPPIRLRFRTVTPQEADPYLGWIIDDLRLRVGNIVTINQGTSGNPSQISMGPPFPNPTNGFVKFRVDASRAATVTILDIAGRGVHNLPIPAGSRNMSVDLDHLPNGIYWIKIQNLDTSPRQIILLK